MCSCFCKQLLPYCLLKGLVCPLSVVSAVIISFKVVNWTIKQKREEHLERAMQNVVSTSIF